ncbi:MAG TPA: lipopolysaccharide biosynthesis protein [Cyanobacteria bacterium UBA11372]|nr:lipopolysaccharide biosynthesis protein [Cyanobacteria bacterium UBA11372]
MESTEFSIGFQQYWLILKRRWLPASAVFVSVFTFTALYLLMQKPVYQAEGKLSFKKTNTTSSITGLGKEIGDLEPVANQSNPMNTEIEVIRSVPMLQKTITQLQLKDETGDPLKIKQFLKQLSVLNTRGADTLTVSYKDNDPETAAAVVNTLIALYIENNQIVNRAEAVSAREFIEKQLPNAEASVRQTEAALRKFKEQNKVVALKEEATEAVKVIAELEAKIAQVRSEFADANAQSQVFQNELRMNPQQALTLTALSQSPAIQEALKQYQQVERQLQIERTRFQETHPVIADLKSKKAALNALLQEQIQKVIGSQKQSPDQNLQIGDVKPKLIEEFVKIEAKRQGFANKVAALSQEQAAYKQRVNVLPRLEQEQRELENKLQAYQSTYALLLQKLQEIRIAENQNVGNARIIQAAFVPDEPVAPRKSLFLVAGVMLGSLLSLATALILEATDQSIKTVEEARELFGLTLLGVIPDLRKPKKNTWRDALFNSYPIPYKQARSRKRQSATPTNDLEQSIPQVVVRETPHSPISAAYRMLQANLRFLSSDRDLKAIAISSSLPGEGKSTLCANLAVTVAQLGRKVLLIDADLHRPVQHRIWELSNQVGLSNVIVGQAELKSAIADVMPNLKVLPSGVIPPNPMALLDSQRIATLIEQFSQTYDLVIIDTPSLNVAADALILGQKTDGILFVVRPGVVDSQSAAFAKELLAKSNQHVLGLVVNGVIPDREPHSYYYFVNESYTEPASERSP